MNESFFAEFLKGIVSRPAESAFFFVALVLLVWAVITQWPKIREERKAERAKDRECQEKMVAELAKSNERWEGSISNSNRVIENNTATIARSTQVSEIYIKSFEGVKETLGRLDDSIGKHDERAQTILTKVSETNALISSRPAPAGK